MYDTTPILRGVGEGFGDIGRNFFLFCSSLPQGKNFAAYYYVQYFSDSTLVSIARNSGIYTKFTTCLQRTPQNPSAVLF